MVASKCSRNHFISEIYKIVPLIMLNFHQNSPFMQIYTCTSDYTGAGNIPGRKIYQNLFSSFVAFLIMSVASQKCRPFNADFSRGSRWKSAGAGWDAPVLTLCSLLRNPWPQSTGVLKNFHEGETNCWFCIYHSVSFWASLRRGIITT